MRVSFAPPGLRDYEGRKRLSILAGSIEMHATRGAS
jgi:hypothetical protein